MTALKKHIRRDGFDLRMIERTGDVAIYEQTRHDIEITRYEVIKIRVAKAWKLPNGQEVPEHEAYPSSEQWGSLGWTLTDLSTARTKAQSVVTISEL